jgi:hypothetical protein
LAEGCHEPKNGIAIPTAPATPTALVAAVRNRRLVVFTVSSDIIHPTPDKHDDPNALWSVKNHRLKNDSNGNEFGREIQAERTLRSLFSSTKMIQNKVLK